ncbi:MAG: TonB-dependent receptor [Cyclobacteriaceae bacterium]
MRKKILLSLLSLLIIISGAAQDSLKMTTLREVVISASRADQSIIEIPRSVAVIGEETIRKSIYQSFGELLNAESSLYVVGANQTPGTNQNLFMRGSNSNQVAVLIDGVRIADPSSPNAAMDLSEVSLTNVERVEIVRGSHSTMYGGAAIGGVINLITKKNGTPGFHGAAGWQGGVFGEDAWSSTENVTLTYNTKNGLYFDGSVFQQNVQGLNASEKSKTFPSFTSDRDNFEKTDASVKAGFRNEIWVGNISFKNVHQFADIDNGAFSDDDNSYLIFDRKLLQYQLGYKLHPYFRLSVLGSFTESERFYEDDSSKVNLTTYDKTYSTGSYYGELQTHEVQLNYAKEDTKGVFGAGLYTEKMFFDSYLFYNDPAFPFELETNYDTLDTSTSTRYIFAQLGHVFGNFNLSAGSRLSNHTTAGNVLTFEVNPSFAFKNLLLYGSFSSGFNAPSLYQLYDPSKGFTAHTTRGNPNLQPEKSISFELGVKKLFSSGSYITFSAYQTKVDNSIEYVYLWNREKPVEVLDFNDDRGDTYINVGEQLVRGLEVEAYAQISDKVSLSGNISALNTRIKIQPDNIDNQHTGGHHVQLFNLGTFLNNDVEQSDLVRRPNFTAYTRLSYEPVPDLGFAFVYRYTGKRFDSGYDGSLGPYGALSRIAVDAYHLVDIGVNWQATKIFGVAVKVDNLLKEEYR